MAHSEIRPVGQKYKQQAINLWQREIHNLLKRFNNDFGVTSAETGESFPKLEVTEKDHSYHVSAEMPGMNMNDINVSLEGNRLILQGERRNQKEEERDGLYSTEFSYGSFYRAIPFNEEVNPDSVKASYKDGLLNIDISKVRSSDHSTRRIKITRS